MKKLSALLMGAALLAVLPGCNNDWEDEKPEAETPANPNPGTGTDAGTDAGTGNGDSPTTSPAPVIERQLGALIDDVFKPNTLALTNDRLPANGSTAVSFRLADRADAALIDLGAQVTITSKCADEGLARFEHTRFYGGGDMTTRYVNQGCVGNDIITAELQGSTLRAQALIALDAPTAGSLTSFEPEHLQISIKGQGSELRPDSTLMTFKLVDNLGQPMANQLVSFALIGTPPAELLHSSAYTDDSGMVSAHLIAGATSGQVQISASVQGGPSVQSPYVLKVVPTIASSLNALPLTSNTLAPRGFAQGEQSDVARVGFQLQDQFGLGISNRAVSFEITSTNNGSTLLVSNATTNDKGIAEAVVQAATDYDQLHVNATFVVNDDVTITGRSAVLTVSAVPSRQLTAALTLAASELNALGTVQVTPGLTANGVSHSSFSTLARFTSTCVEQGLATFSPATTSGDSLASTYADLGCVGEDNITVMLSSEGQEWTLNESILIRHPATSLTQLAVSHSQLAALGHGSTEQPDSVLVPFQLLDSQGRPVAKRRLDFSVVNSNPTAPATLLTGHATTNAQGVAQASLRAGADYNLVQVRAQLLEGETTLLSNLSAPIKVASNPSLALRAGQGTGEGFVADQLGVTLNRLAVGGETALQVNLVNGTANYRNFSTEVSFSSTCSLQGLASFTPAVVRGANLGSTYQVQGCVGQDLITATVRSNDQVWLLQSTVRITTNDIPQTPASIQSLPPEFPFLAIRGYGTSKRPELTAVPFRVVDAQGQPVAQQEVTFKLDNQLSGAELVTATATTDAEGIAIARLRAGLGNDLINIVAETGDDNNMIGTQSSYQVSVSSGLPRDGWLSFVTPILNPAGIYDVIGASVPWSIVAADGHSGSAPLEGVQFKFFTNSGLLDFSAELAQSGCELVNGRCALSWINNSPMPADGVVRALAYSYGVENFVDTNNNGMLDIGEYFCPLAEPFLKIDDSGHFVPGAPFVDVDNDGKHTTGERNASCPPALTVAQAEASGYVQAAAEGLKYRGAACSQTAKSAGHCDGLAVLSRDLFFVTPDSASMAITTTDGSTVDVSSGSVTRDFNVRDKNDNIPAAGTAFSVSCKEGSARIVGVPGNSMPNMYRAPGDGYDFRVLFDFTEPEKDEEGDPVITRTSCEIKVGGASYTISMTY